MAAIVDVYSVKPFKTQWRIRVKILKKWKQYFDGVETMEMIVVDERNQVIHCTVKKEFIRRMDALFVEGETRIITNFTVSAASGRFRTSGHVYKIVLAQTTTIRTDLDLPPNVLGLHPIRFNDIHDGKLNPDFLIDVFGQIVEIGDVEMLNVSKKQTKRLTMVLRDTEESDVRLNCVLWGEFAEQLEALAQNLHEVVVVFVLRFGKIRLYQNVWSVGNCYNCSIVMNNPDLPEVIAFRNRLPKDGVTLSYTHPNQLTIINSVSVREDFLTQSPRRTISEIVSASENVKCVTMATIMSIDTEYGWYYMECQTCKKKVLPVDMEAVKHRNNEPGHQLSDEQLKNYALIAIEKIMRSNGTSLTNYDGMPTPPTNYHNSGVNRLLFDERKHNKTELAALHDNMFPGLTDEQRSVYKEIMDAVSSGRGGTFFVYGFGGTGKTHIWKIISAAIRSKGEIVLNVASSGIAALLLPGGRTAHSRFGIPLNPDEFTMCNIHPGTDLAELVSESSLIIWDEAPMMSRHCFESLDRSMRDIIVGGRDKPFGGKVIVFGGDFRQILPVITGGGREEIVLAALNSSYIWENCKVLRLTKNMRLLADLDDTLAREIKDFSEWILKIGDGKVNNPNTGEVMIDIPKELLITSFTDPVEAIVDSVYGSGFGQSCDSNFFHERAILCPTNDDVNEVNDYMLSLLTGEERVYLSSDSIDPSDTSNRDSSVYTADFLNNLKMSGLPHHVLRLRVGAPVMLLRNIDPKGGLCNGTRLQVTQLADHVIEAIILAGDFNGIKVCIPRLCVSPPEGKYPFRMRRRQFPVAVAFAMTINKSQGQTLSSVGLYLPKPVFSHGQLYVALSRVKSKSGLKVLIIDKDGNPHKQTMNVVFKEVFQNIDNHP